MEGVALEAASLAGPPRPRQAHLSSTTTTTSRIDGATTSRSPRTSAARFEAYGWHVQTVDDGNDLDAIDRGDRGGRGGDATGRRSSSVRTHIGYGSPHKQDTSEAHGEPLGAEEVRLTKQNLGWPVERAVLRPRRGARGTSAQRRRRAARRAERAWRRSARRVRARRIPTLAAELERALRGELPAGWDERPAEFPGRRKRLATRAASGKVINALAARAAGRSIGGSPTSIRRPTRLKSTATSKPGVQPRRSGRSRRRWSYGGRNLHFGVREHAMGAIAQRHRAARRRSSRTAATFLVFSDYMRPAIRLAALMAAARRSSCSRTTASASARTARRTSRSSTSRRCAPSRTSSCIRPADANETAEAWRVAVERQARPRSCSRARSSRSSTHGAAAAGTATGRLRAGRRRRARRT